MSAQTKFDPDASWGALERRMESEKDPRRRQLLQQVRDHMQTEISGQLEPLMETLIDEPQYHFRGLGFDMGPKGQEKVYAFYRDMIAGGGNRFQFDIRRIVVDEDSVVTEGYMRSVTTGADLIASGSEEVNGEAVDPSARYLGESRILTVWPADEDGRLVGEDIWFGSPPNAKLEKL